MAEFEPYERGLKVCRLPAYGVHDGARLRECSEDLAHMFGATSPADVVGRAVLEFIAPEARDQSISAILAGKAGAYNSTGLRLDGRRFPILITSAPVQHRGSGARLVLVRNLSPIALVVDDEAPIARLTAFLLRDTGYQSTVYTNPSNALAEYEPGAASVVVTDVSMPELDGPTMAERIRSVDPGVPVIFMSGSWTPQEPESAGTAFLKKPFTQRDLQDALSNLPSRARSPLQ